MALKLPSGLAGEPPAAEVAMHREASEPGDAVPSAAERTASSRRAAAAVRHLDQEHAGLLRLGLRLSNLLEDAVSVTGPEAARNGSTSVVQELDDEVDVVLGRSSDPHGVGAGTA